jgi:hypothetical protein
MTWEKTPIATRCHMGGASHGRFLAALSTDEAHWKDIDGQASTFAYTTIIMLALAVTADLEG